MLLNGLRWGLAGSIFLLGALVLTVPRGIGYGALPMLLLSLLMLAVGFRQQVRALNSTEWLFIAALAAYPLAAALAMLFHGEWVWAHFDKPSRFLLSIPVFLAIRKYGTSEKAWYWGLAVGAIGAGILGYYQKYVWGWNVASGYTHKIPFGDISLMLGVLAITYLIPAPGRNDSRLLQGLVIVALLLGLAGSFSSGTRGGWVAIPFLAWLMLTAMISRRTLRWGVFALLIAGLVGVYLSNDLVRHKVDRAVTTTHGYFAEGTVAGSAGTRFEMWRGAWLQFQEKPWTGGGKDTYGPRLKQLMAEGKVNPGSVYTHAHNDLLNLLAELGVLGGLALVLFYGLMVLFFIRTRSIDVRLATAGLALCFGYIDFSLTQAMLEHNNSTAFLALMLSVIGGQLARHRISAKKESGTTDSLAMGYRPRLSKS